MKNEITISETRDPKAVWDIAQHWSVKENVTDDKWAKFDFKTLANFVQAFVALPQNHSLLVRLDGHLAGCWLLDWKGDGRFEIHTMLLPECRGRLGLQAGRAAMAYAATLPEMVRLESYCPDTLPQSLLFALMCRWRDCGVSERKWVKDGKTHAMRRVEITKEEILCL